MCMLVLFVKMESSHNTRLLIPSHMDTADLCLNPRNIIAYLVSSAHHVFSYFPDCTRGEECSK
jgi:hypothetical protein